MTSRSLSLRRYAFAAALALGIVIVPGVALVPSARAGSIPQVQPSPTPSSGCLVCHGDPEILEAQGSRPTLLVRQGTIAGSVHSRLDCQDCHGTLGAMLHADPQGELERARGSCDACHVPQAAAYFAGVHGPSSGLPALEPSPAGGAPPLLPSLVVGGRPSVRPTCVSCHGAHDAPPAGSRAFAIDSAGRCSGCHAERGESFFDRDYHGKESRLGREDVAVCSDCHGAHLVVSASDARSPVNPANVLTTCRRCHPDAPPNYAGILVHVGGRPLPADAKLKVVTIWMTLLLVGTFGFFGTHTMLAIRHAWRQQGRPRDVAG